MKKELECTMKHLLFSVSVILTCCCAAPVAVGGEGSAVLLLAQLESAAGAEYRTAAAQAVKVSGISETLREYLGRQSQNDDERSLIAKILLARLSRPDAFAEFHQYLGALREMHGSRSLGIRPGYLSGRFVSFARMGSETTSIEVFKGWEEREGATMPRYERVAKYTEQEVTAGKSRNAAVRMAILEHLLKFLGEGCEYEQREFVRAAYRLWGGDSPARHVEDGIPIERLLLRLCDDQDRLLSVRAVALQQFAPHDRGERELPLMLDVLKSNETENWGVHHDVVADAIEYLAEHAPETLKGIEGHVHWKQELINKAAGLPPPPPAPPEPGRRATPTEDQGLLVE